MAAKRSIRLRYSLRALLVSVTLFGVWGGFHTNRAIKERRAVEVLSGYNISLPTRGPKKRGDGLWHVVSFAYQRTVHLIWHEPFITSVALECHPEADIVAAVADLPHLEDLSIAPPPLTGDAGWRWMNGHRDSDYRPREPLAPGTLAKILRGTHLRCLFIGGWILSDEDQDAIGNDANLESLFLRNTGISERALPRILALPKLSRVGLVHCDATGGLLGGCLGSTTLESIDCSDSHVGVTFADYMARCKRLRTLNAGMSNIDDHFITKLAAHPSLAEVGLYYTNVTDLSLPALRTLPSLQYLMLPRNTTTQQEVDKLKAARPLLSISR